MDRNRLIPKASHDGDERRLLVTSSPHIRASANTRSVMLDVIIALIPALIMGVFFFGWRVLGLAMTGVASCVAFEWLYRYWMKKPAAVGDLSAVVTGLILTLVLPAGTPYPLMVVGSFFAIVVVKQLYGGIGKNFMNPALAARAFLVFSFTAALTLYPDAFSKLPLFGNAGLDSVTSATPMAALHAGVLPDFTMMELFLGQHGGSMGETSVLVILLGGLWLVMRRVISPRIPLWFLGTVAVLTFAFPNGGANNLQWMTYELLSGGLVFGAVFMATDYTTSPVTPRGQVLYAIGCGMLTVFLRYFGSSPDGVCFAILIMNICTWLLDKAGAYRRKEKGGDAS